MDIADCYRVLGLTSVASAKDVKTSYRRLARQWHPDVNPDNQHAHDMFIQVTAAYKVLLGVVPAGNPVSPELSRHAPSTPPPQPSSRTSPPPQSVSTAAPRSSRPAPQSTSQASPQPQADQPSQTQSSPRPDPAYQVKLQAYDQLQGFLRMKRYPRAIALIEALSQRLPEDPEIKQWQAIIYQRWGRQLIADRKYNQARAYLKKAFNTDPNNKSLLAEIERDLKAIQTSV